MNSEEIRKSLDVIYKHGDLHDVISLKEGTALRKKSFLKFNVLLFSRILYGGVLIWEKIKQKLAPIEKIKNAQELIRKKLGVNVDVITFKPMISTTEKEKNNNKFLSLLYIEDDIDMAIYIDNLQKILNFVEVYHLDRVYLRLSDILDYFIGVNLEDFEITGLKEIMGGYLEDFLDEDIIVLQACDLLKLINRLKDIDINKAYIGDLGDKIEDLVIKNAIEDFEKDEDLDKLKEVVKVRLELILNSENSHKDRIYGKVLETINLWDEYVKIVVKKQNGEVIQDKIMTLYDYLDVLDYQTLISRINDLSDDNELLLIATLYLYLIQNNKVQLNCSDSLSFYDKLYNRYKKKENKEIKYVRGIYSKSYKRRRNIFEYMKSLVMNIALIYAICFAGVSIDLINGFFFRNEDSNAFENMLNTIIKPYSYSWNLELEILQQPLKSIGKGLIYTFDSLSSLVGDVTEEIEDKKLAIINNLNNNNELPRYFATSYAFDRMYNEGSVIYSTSTPNTLFFGNVTPLFEITHSLNKNALKNLINGNKINLTNTFYPVGDDYILSSIFIKDMASDKTFMIDYNRAVASGNNLSLEEVDYLLTMENPRITYTYGLSEYSENFFVQNMQEKGYTGGKSEIKEAITNGLGLSEDASLEEIWTSIKSKFYSTTPIKDAGLTNYVKTLNEEEYFEVVAALDSLVCNLAASLAVESSDDLFYVVGYLNNGDEYLSSGEAHAWAMDDKGEIIDTTPIFTLEEKDIIKTVLAWGIQNNIHIYILLTLSALLIKKFYGKNIVLSLNILKINYLLDNPNIFNAYAKINQVLYGGVNIPRKTSKIIFIDKIYKDFMVFNKEDLESLKAKLKQEEDNRLALRLVSEIPTIRDNYEVLKRTLEKEKSRKRK